MAKTIPEPIMHPATAKLLKGVIASPPNSLGLIGEEGMGKTTLAQWLIRNLTNNQNLQLNDSPYCKLITTGDKTSIALEQIREINKFVKLKTTGINKLRRFVVIENADLMTSEAQNALLKLLEEPPVDTMIILTIDNPQNIFPTVMSRIVIVVIKKPSKDQVRIKLNISPKDFDKLYTLAGGLPGLLQSIASNPENHSLIVALDKVRSVLAQKSYGRLISVTELSSDKAETKLFLDVLDRLAKVSVEAAVNKDDGLSADRWLKILGATAEAQEALSLNANAKLTLTDLFLNLV